MTASPEHAKEFLDKLNEKKDENASINVEVVKNSFEAELGKLSQIDQTFNFKHFSVSFLVKHNNVL